MHNFGKQFKKIFGEDIMTYFDHIIMKWFCYIWKRSSKKNIQRLEPFHRIVEYYLWFYWLIIMSNHILDTVFIKIHFWYHKQLNTFSICRIQCCYERTSSGKEKLQAISILFPQTLQYQFLHLNRGYSLIISLWSP